MVVHRLQDELLCGSAEVPIRAVDHPQPRIVLEAFPALLQPRGMRCVHYEVHRHQLVGLQSLPVAQSLDLGEVDRIDKDEHPKSRMPGQLGIVGARHFQNRGLGAVLPVEPN